MQHRWIGIRVCACIALLIVAWVPGTGQSATLANTASAAAPEPSTVPIKISMEELHQHGGVPPGWQFSFPTGNPTAGRGVFETLECYQCHAVQGERFPTSSENTKLGPALTGMGDHHPVAYLAESILSPNAVIVTGSGHTGDDGLSIMPDYRDSLSVSELIDLVAYLHSLAGEDSHAETDHHEGHAAAKPLFEQVVGAYRVRLYYLDRGLIGHDHRGHGHSKHAKAGTPAKPVSHLVILIDDAQTGQPVPYLPVSATITATKTPPLQVKLLPMLGDMGLHYGADVTLPSSPATISLSIGIPTIRVMPSAAGRFSTAQQMSFDWSPQTVPRPVESGQSPPHQGHDAPITTKDH